MHGYARERQYGNVLTGGSRRNGPAEGFRVNNNGAERCVLCVACRTLGVARRMLYIACMVHVVCRMSYVVWRILYGASCMAHLVCRCRDFRMIRISNETFQSSIGRHAGGCEVMTSIGFDDEFVRGTREPLLVLNRVVPDNLSVALRLLEGHLPVDNWRI